MRYAFAIMLVCCSQPAMGTDAGVDATLDAPIDSGKRDSGADANVAVDTGTEDALNGCGQADFVDRSEAGARTIAWSFNVDPRCIVVAKGQAVTWQGDLASHPLAALGGDMPSPIQTTNMGSSVSFAFGDAGDFGFVCSNHQPMTGVVRVQ